MRVRGFLILLLSYIFIGNGYCTTYETTIDIVFSKNKKHKAIISPIFCNEDSCLENSFDLSYADTTIRSDFRKQEIFLYKLQHNQYQKIRTYEVPIDKFFFSGAYSAKINDKGTKIIFFDFINLKGAMIDLSDTVRIVDFNIFVDFDLSPDETARLIEELMYKEGKSKIQLQLTDNKCTIRLTYLDQNKNRYLNKERILPF